MTRTRQISLSTCIFIIFGLLTACTSNPCDCEDKTKNNTEVKKDQNSDILISDKHYLKDFEPINKDGSINVVVEIPAGSLEKWEIDKKDGNIKLEYIDNEPRIVQYLAYPGNYGMIPRTILPKELGGDGDPLDVLVLGDASPRGAIVKCKIIGVLKMLDRGEQDDKLIAVKEESPFYSINSIAELDIKFVGTTNIISTWFANYKGPNQIEIIGFDEKEIAEKILNDAINEYTHLNK